MSDASKSPHLAVQVYQLFARDGLIAHTRQENDHFVVDLCQSDGHVLWPFYSSDSEELVALLVAEQRYLTEEVGDGAMPGASYADKAVERIRRWQDAG